MTVIIKNANLTNIAKTPAAIAQWIETHGGKERVTIEWLSKNACFVYSEGEKDKMTINIH